ncbi:unnamed protein product [Peniophora sp. CBMAI 1063]|nr:unnamed protein product [Peniophora sp. CBMAI 1063]
MRLCRRPACAVCRASLIRDASSAEHLPFLHIQYQGVTRAAVRDGIRYINPRLYASTQQACSLSYLQRIPLLSTPILSTMSGNPLKALDVNPLYLGQGIYIQKDTTVKDEIYVAVTKTDVNNGSSAWYEPGDDVGITWKPLTNKATDNSHVRRNGGYEIVSFKDAKDTQRKALYLSMAGRSSVVVKALTRSLTSSIIIL